MAQASNETELVSAIDSKASWIELTSDITVSHQISIDYSLRLSSSSPGCPFLILKDCSLYEPVFQITNGSLTLENVILDGQKELHLPENPSNGPLIHVHGGSLILKSNTILQNNFCFQGGGGICLEGLRSGPTCFLMDDESKIRLCSSRTCGGAVMFSARYSQDQLSILGRSSLEENTACHGGGIYLRSESRLAPAALTLSDSVSITGNTAFGFGGGINFSGFREGSGKASSLSASGNVSITDNKASYGGGIFYRGSNDGDQLDLLDGCHLCRNSASEDGGALCLSSDYGASVTVAGGFISDNSAGNNGGGIFLKNHGEGLPARLALMDCKLSRNLSSCRGGAIAFLPGTGDYSLHLTETKFKENTCASDGGGMFIQSEGNGLMNVSQTLFTKNSSEKRGGGLALCLEGKGHTDSLSFTSTSFSLNTSGTDGGGLWLSSKTGALETICYNCNITDNAALTGSGGGVCLSGAETSLSLRGICRLSENLAGMNGFGISLQKGSYVLLDHGLKLSDSIYFEDERSVLRLEDSLASGAAVQLESSAYLFPNKQGTPITVAKAVSEYNVLHLSDLKAFKKPANSFYGWEFRLNSEQNEVLLLPPAYNIEYVNLMESSHSNPHEFTVLSSDITLSDPSPLIDCRFLGWYDDPFEGHRITRITGGSVGDITLYAHWAPFPHPAEQNSRDFSIK